MQNASVGNGGRQNLGFYVMANGALGWVAQAAAFPINVLRVLASESGSPSMARRQSPARRRRWAWGQPPFRSSMRPTGWVCQSTQFVSGRLPHSSASGCSRTRGDVDKVFPIRARRSGRAVSAKLASPVSLQLLPMRCSTSPGSAFETFRLHLISCCDHLSNHEPIG